MSWHYLGLFALGCLGCAVAFSPQFAAWRRISWLWPLIASSLIVAILTKVPLWHGKVVPLALTDYFVGVWALTLLVYLSVQPEGLLHRCFSWKPLVFLGTFAYSIYLIHAPLQQVVWQIALRPLDLSPRATFVGLAMATPIIIVFCYGFFLVAERPFLSKKHRKSVDQIASQTAANA